MARRFYGLPALNALDAFEAAARLGSFKEAASELGVTPGAVSHQIKSLEMSLGVAVFRRAHRAVELTPKGRTLAEALERGLTTISHAIHSINRIADSASVTIGATSAMSSLWLTPRITRFWKYHGDITVNQQISDRRFARPLELDMVIEYGLRRVSDTTELLFKDTLVPLCSPEFAKGIAATDLAEIAEQPLIHLDAPDHNWTTWISWFEALGYHGEVRSGQRVNNYTIALQLAQDSGGVVLGWRRLVAPLIARGALVPLGDFENPAPGAFYLTVRENPRLDKNAGVFQAWLRDNINMN